MSGEVLCFNSKSSNFTHSIKVSILSILMRDFIDKYKFRRFPFSLFLHLFHFLVNIPGQSVSVLPYSTLETEDVVLLFLLSSDDVDELCFPIFCFVTGHGDGQSVLS